MMFNFPFYPYHHSRYYMHNNYSHYNRYNAPEYYAEKAHSKLSSESNIKKNQTVHNKKSNKEVNKNKSLIDFSNIDTNNYILDLFGIKLYYDDILLLCLIFFLYTEGIKDESLFIILILLLLS